MATLSTELDVGPVQSFAFKVLGISPPGRWVH
jgi:hypothetical protein